MEKTPWLRVYGETRFHLDYPDCSMYRAIERMAQDMPSQTALTYLDNNFTYKTVLGRVRAAALGLRALGVGRGDRVLICLPNTPQAVYSLYAVNMLGAVACLVHPLSAVGELVFYIHSSDCKVIITLDTFYDKMAEAMGSTGKRTVVVTNACDELPCLTRLAADLTGKSGRVKLDYDSQTVDWRVFSKSGKNICEAQGDSAADKDAVVLFSGGTTGTTKGIVLTNLNFNALALQTAEMSHKEIRGAKMLAAMPMFHGFGLGVCVHTALVCGASSILVPRFGINELAGIIRKHRPNFIAGVPTLFEALTRVPDSGKMDLSCLMGVFSGGDTLTTELKAKIDSFLAGHGATVRVREGYGTTECVTASCLTPYNAERAGSIGLPFPDTYYKICAENSTNEAEYMTDGEICISGPTVMKGYLNFSDENALRLHPDGRVWLHTGDIGCMDSDGFIYFKQRIKRVIVSSGYNIYPSQIEKVLQSHEAVDKSCVVGVSDEYKMHKVKAYVTLHEGYAGDEKLRTLLMEYCHRNIAKYAMPYDIEFLDKLPMTRVGKVAFCELEKKAERTAAAERKQPR